MSWSLVVFFSVRFLFFEFIVKNIIDIVDGFLVIGSVFGVEVIFLVDIGVNMIILKFFVVNKIFVLE